MLIVNVNRKYFDNNSSILSNHFNILYVWNCMKQKYPYFKIQYQNTFLSNYNFCNMYEYVCIYFVFCRFKFYILKICV